MVAYVSAGPFLASKPGRDRDGFIHVCYMFTRPRPLFTYFCCTPSRQKSKLRKKHSHERVKELCLPSSPSPATAALFSAAFSVARHQNSAASTRCRVHRRSKHRNKYAPAALRSSSRQVQVGDQRRGRAHAAPGPSAHRPGASHRRRAHRRGVRRQELWAILAASGRIIRRPFDGIDWNVGVLDDDMHMDAHSNSTGTIRISTGMLGFLRNDAQVAAVLGHEVACLFQPLPVMFNFVHELLFQRNSVVGWACDSEAH